MISKEKLDFWIKNQYNVLFEGHHGCGKTAIVTQAFNDAGLNWKYFSASTLDPWVDLVGVPKEYVDSNGTKYLDLVRPKEFAYDTIEALFFDELNRSHKKVRNALMELIQFKSINGKVFKNLKIVWAAVNPDNEDYDVEKLDPAQADRFQIQVNIPYKLDKDYFVNKYGVSWFKSATEWWGQIPKEVKFKVSPRRVDYALEVFSRGGDIKDVLDISSNPSKLIGLLSNGPIIDKLEELFRINDPEENKKFFSLDNFLNSKKYIAGDSKYMNYFLPFIPKEVLASEFTERSKFFPAIIQSIAENPVCMEIVKETVASGKDEKLITKIQSTINSRSRLREAYSVPSSLSNLNLTPNDVISQSSNVETENFVDDLFWDKVIVCECGGTFKKKITRSGPFRTKSDKEFYQCSNHPVCKRAYTYDN